METKKEKIVSAVATIGIILTLFGATYAYFAAKGDAGKTTGVEITANTVDVFSFETGDSISISLNQDNFASGKGNQTGETFAKAILSANNKTNTATEHYYLYLSIDSNTFDYTSEDNKPEILVKITKNGTEVTSGISNLTYASVTDANNATVTGFDITNKTRLIKIADNTEITTTSTTTDEWKFYVTFVNYDYDQTDNAGKSFSADIFIQKDVIPQVIGDVCDTGGNLAECIKVLTINSASKYTNLYLHDDTLENGAGDNSYRYSGAHDEVNNFVCFGSEAATCPDDNLYRIIGVFGDQVKLIKWDYVTTSLIGTGSIFVSEEGNITSYYKGSNSTSSIGVYYWNSTGSNTWSTSTLNTTNLNTNFINNIGTTWSNKIAKTTWKVGGNTGSNIRGVQASVAYKNEYTNPAESTTYEDKIGLMYTSDYGFAASPSAWTTTLYSYNSSSITSVNWMYMGLNEWTVVRRSNNTSGAFYVHIAGLVNVDAVDYRFGARAVRPVFYLNSDVAYVSGSGTKTNPITIN